ncbi:glycosyltransferase family 2 protein [Pseudoponticoccus marisrubri]|uniref:glycosyltransferase family 2 protein n=1 Tax=Pseudoponticoccus marisrubri TaxID=1685382 RepID=UPI0012FDC21A|nr:glycosyltransferase family 2 protein [Pseudoponticoccus marisrubri]
MPIISLTSIPPRFHGLSAVVESLLCQTANIEEIRIYIPSAYRRFPDWSKTLPAVPDGINVVRVADDLGPASKVLHASQDLSATSTPILFCDDDRIYPPDWATGLLDAHATRPNECVAAIGRQVTDVMAEAVPLHQRNRAKVGKQYFDPRYRLQRIGQQWREKRLRTRGEKPARRLVARSGYVDLLQGYAGAVMLPHFVDEAWYDIPDDIWMVDDIWLSGHLARRNIPIWLPKRQEICKRAPNDAIQALRNCVFDEAGRDASNRRAISYFQETYGIWR